MKKRRRVKVFCLFAALAFPPANANPAGLKAKEALAENPFLHSFRPLLIQGKKRLSQKIKDMKVETGSAAESRLFFERPDFKKRIFENEDLSE